ncbi:MAG: hypothetical protein Q9191_003461 [Dirinaria sp. TL-2023a]
MENELSALPACKENRGTVLLWLAWTLQILAIIVVFLRIWLRRKIRDGISWDDYFIVASLIDAIIGVGFMTKMVRAGAGKHIYCLALGRIPVAIQWSIYAQIVNNIGIGLVKISVCLCVLRVIDRVGKWLSRFLWVLIAFVTASHFVQVKLAPASAAAFELTLRSIAGCAIAKAATLKGVFSKDYTWGITKPAVWTITEHLLGITIASLPALRPLFKWIFEVATTQRSASSGLSFRKMHRSERGVHVQISSLVNRASSSGGRTIAANDKDITKTTELRISTETDLNYVQEPSSAWATPDRDRPFGYEHV